MSSTIENSLREMVHGVIEERLQEQEVQMKKLKKEWIEEMEARLHEKEQHMRFLRMKEVVARVGVSKTTIQYLVNAGKFPKPLKFGANISAWVSTEVEDWQRAQSEKYRSSTKSKAN